MRAVLTSAASCSHVAIALLALLCFACGGAAAENERGGVPESLDDNPAADEDRAERRSSSSTRQYGGLSIAGPNEARNHYAPVMSMLVPGYSFRVMDSDRPSQAPSEHGFVWSIPVLIAPGHWRHAAAVSYAEYLQDPRWTLRAVYRFRMMSASIDNPIFHIFLGAGGNYDSVGGFGPRAEVNWLLGSLGRGGGLVITGYEYHPNGRSHVGEIALAFFIPYVIR